MHLRFISDAVVAFCINVWQTNGYLSHLKVKPASRGVFIPSQCFITSVKELVCLFSCLQSWMTLMERGWGENPGALGNGGSGVCQSQGEILKGLWESSPLGGSITGDIWTLVWMNLAFVQLSYCFCKNSDLVNKTVWSDQIFNCCLFETWLSLSHSLARLSSCLKEWWSCWISNLIELDLAWRFFFSYPRSSAWIHSSLWRGQPGVE